MASGSSPTRACRWPRRRRSPARPVSRGSSSGWRSRARSGAPCGGTLERTARAHDAEARTCLDEPAVTPSAGPEAPLGPDELRLGYRDSRLKHVPAESPPEIVTSATFRLTPADPALIGSRLDEIRRWRQAH